MLVYFRSVLNLLSSVLESDPLHLGNINYSLSRMFYFNSQSTGCDLGHRLDGVNLISVIIS